MADYQIDLDDVRIYRLDGFPERGFDCGHEDQNSFLYKHAWEDRQELLSSTYLYYVHGILAGYATFCPDALLLSRRERGPRLRLESVGALKLAQLGVHRPFQGCGLGSHIISTAIILARDVAERIGCRDLTLDARQDVVEWYERLGFERNQLMQEVRVERAVKTRRDPARLATSMRYDIRPEV